MPDYWISAYNSDLASQAGRLVYVSKQALWVSDRGAKPRKILEASGKEVIERPVLSSDGMQIAYSLWSSGEGGISPDIWTINADGSDNRLVVADTRQYLKEASPFRMVPAAWSADKTVLYLNTTSNSEATLKGLYMADLERGTVEKAETPPVTLWDIAFSPDRQQIAYRAFQWVDKPGYPVAGPPYTLNITDLVSGETRVRFESQEERYAYPVWSPEGENLAYLKTYPDGGQGIWVLLPVKDGLSSVVSRPDTLELRPWAWLPGDRIIYTENFFGPPGVKGNDRKALYSIEANGTWKYLIDAAQELAVLGVLKD